MRGANEWMAKPAETDSRPLSPSKAHVFLSKEEMVLTLDDTRRYCNTAGSGLLAQVQGVGDVKDKKKPGIGEATGRDWAAGG